MNSIWDFNSLIKLGYYSRTPGHHKQHIKCVQSSWNGNFVEYPSCSFLGPRNSVNDVRWHRIPLATERNNATSESSTMESKNPETAVGNNQLPYNTQPMVNGTNQASSETEKPMPKRPPLTAREKLRAARVLSKYNESKPAKPEMGNPVLEALRESNKGKRRSRLPEAPTNLLDDSKRGLPKQGLTFNLPASSDLLLIAFSFVFISTVMFATTYIVWKAGAIHFNEY